ncbi:MAG: hypothetical protein QGI06_10115 [Rhodospirillales bacterium]|jgi:hypothetical protein|nr:hypothetical protein [Rhodospirillales bacterium]
MAPSSVDAKRKLEEAKRHLEQLKGEEEARMRRVALRKGRREFQHKKLKGQSTWWLKPFLSTVSIVGVLILIAWYWPLVQKFLQ